MFFGLQYLYLVLEIFVQWSDARIKSWYFRYQF